MDVVTKTGDGPVFDLESLDQELVYSAGVLVAFEVVYRGDTYRQTLTRTDGKLTGISKWVKQ